MDELPSPVIEIESADVQAVRRAFEGRAEVHSVAQLGLKLHLLVDRQVADPAAWARSVLSESGVEAHVEQTRANLEDVFVAATSVPLEPRTRAAAGGPR
jgi:ABC-2 type transport system ATP-binding protein